MKVTAALGAFFLAAVLVVLGSSAFAAGPAIVTGLTFASPSHDVTGGQVVTITGTGFVTNGAVSAITFFKTTGGAELTGDAVRFTDSSNVGVCPGTLPGSGLTWNQFCVSGDSQIYAFTPAHFAATVDVQVVNGSGSSATSVSDQFSYTAATPTLTTYTTTGAGPAAAGAWGTVTTATPLAATIPSGTVLRIAGTPGAPEFATTSGVALQGATTITFAGTATNNHSTSVLTIFPYGSSPCTSCVANTDIQNGDTLTLTGGHLGWAQTVTWGAFVYVLPDAQTPGGGPDKRDSNSDCGTNGTTTGGNPTATFADACAPVQATTSAAGTFKVLNDNQIQLIAPAHAGGTTANLTVTTAGGAVSFGFTFRQAPPTVTAITPASGPFAGGSVVTVTGTNLDFVSAVTFGGTAGTAVTPIGSTSLTVASPAENGGMTFSTGCSTCVDVQVTTGGGTSALNRGAVANNDEFAYVSVASLTVTGTNTTPAAGPLGGGTLTNVTGTGFLNFNTGSAMVSAVKFGGKPGTSLSFEKFTTTGVGPAAAGAWGTVTLSAPLLAAVPTGSVFQISGAPGAAEFATTTGTAAAGSSTLAFTGAATNNHSGSVLTIQRATVLHVLAPSSTGPAVTYSTLAEVDVTAVALDGGSSAAVAGDLYTYYGFSGSYSAPVTGGNYTLTGQGFSTGSTATWSVQVVNGGAAATPAVPGGDTSLGPLASGQSVNFRTRLTDITITSSNTTSFTLAGSFQYNPLISAIAGLSSPNPADCSTTVTCTVTIVGNGFQSDVGANASVTLDLGPQPTGQPFDNSSAPAISATTIGVGPAAAGAWGVVTLSAPLSAPIPSGTPLSMSGTPGATEFANTNAFAKKGDTTLSFAGVATNDHSGSVLTIVLPNNGGIVIQVPPGHTAGQLATATVHITSLGAVGAINAANNPNDQILFVAPPTVTAIFNNSGTRGAYNDGSGAPVCPSATLFDSIAGGITAGANTYTVCGTGFQYGATNVVTNVQVSNGVNTFATATETTTSGTVLTWAPDASALPPGEYKVQVDSIYGSGTPSPTMLGTAVRPWETQIFTVYPNINAPNGGDVFTWTNGPLSRTARASLPLDSVLGTTFAVNFLQGATPSGPDFLTPTTTITQNTVSTNGIYLDFRSVLGFTTGGFVDMQAVVNGIPSPATRPNDQFDYVTVSAATAALCNVAAPYGQGGTTPCSNNAGGVLVTVTGVGFIDAFGNTIDDGVGTEFGNQASFYLPSGSAITSTAALTYISPTSASFTSPNIAGTDQVGRFTISLDTSGGNESTDTGGVAVGSVFSQPTNYDYIYYPEVTSLNTNTAGPLTGATTSALTGTGFTGTTCGLPLTTPVHYGPTTESANCIVNTDTSLDTFSPTLASATNTYPTYGAGSLPAGQVDITVTVNGIVSPLYRTVAGNNDVFSYVWISDVTAPDTSIDCPTINNGGGVSPTAFAARSLEDTPGSGNYYAPNCGGTVNPGGLSSVSITGFNFQDFNGANTVDTANFFAAPDLAFNSAQATVTGANFGVITASSITVVRPSHVAELRKRISLTTSGSVQETSSGIGFGPGAPAFGVACAVGAFFCRDTFTFFPQVAVNAGTEPLSNPGAAMTPTSGGASGGTTVVFGGFGLDFTNTPPFPGTPTAASNPTVFWDYTNAGNRYPTATISGSGTDTGFGTAGTDDSTISAVSPAHQSTCGAVVVVVNGVQSSLYGGTLGNGFCWVPQITAVSAGAPGSGQSGPTAGGNSVSISGFGFTPNPASGFTTDIPGFVPAQGCVAPAVLGKTNGTLNGTVFPGATTFTAGGPFVNGTPYTPTLTLASGSTYAIPANSQVTIANSFSSTQVLYTSAAVAQGGTAVPIKTFTANADYPNGSAIDLPAQFAIAPTNDRQITIPNAPAQWACTDLMSVIVPSVDAFNTPIFFTATATAPTANYTFVAPAPVITSIFRNSESGGGQSVLVTGTGFGFTSVFNVTINGQPAFAAGSTPPATDTSFTAVIPAGLANGVYDLVVTTDGGPSLPSAGSKYYVGQAPTLTGSTSSNYSDAPYASGPVAAAGSAFGLATVTVNGTGFNQTPLTVLVGATDVTSSVVVISPTKLTFTAPAIAAGLYDIHVNSGGGNSTATGTTASSYEAVAAPSATAIAPSSGPSSGNQVVTLTGTNFAPTSTLGSTAFSLGGTAIKVTSWTIGGTAQNAVGAITGTNGTTFGSTTVAHVAGAAFAVTTTDVYGTNGTATFTFVPSASSVTPNSGPATGGTAITIGGSGFGTVPANVTVTFGTAAAGVVTVVGVTTAADNSITLNTPANVPALANSPIIVIVNGASSSDVLYFNFLPAVTSVKNVGTNGTTAAPGAGATGDNQGSTGGGYKIAVDGTGFDMTTATNNAVTIGGTAAMVTGFDGVLGVIVTANSMAAGTYDVRVTTNGAQSPTTPADQFIYRGAPTLVSINPNSGPLTGGQSVLVTATNIYDSASNHPVVTIGGNPLTLLTTTSTTASGVTPAAAIAGRRDVVLTTAFGSATITDGYAYLPTIYAVTNPTTGDNQLPLGGATVTVSGTGFDVAGNDTVSLVARAPGAQITGPIAVNTVTGSTILTFTAPAGTAGAYDVRVRVNGVDSSVNNSTAFYRLGESTGATTAYDSSANGHTGTASAGVTFGQTGALAGNTAAAFNGTTGVVTVPSFAPFTPTGGNRTVDFWMKTTSTTYMPLFSTGSYPAPPIGAYFFIGSVPANVGFAHAAGIYIGTYGSDAVIPANVTDGAYHHIVVSESGSGSLNVYIDGAQPAGFIYTAGFGWSAATQPMSLVAPSTGATPVYLGYSNNLPAFSGLSNNYFTGTLDEVTVYSSTRGTQPAGSDSVVYQPAPTVGSFSPTTLAPGANAGTVNGTNYLDSILIHPTFTVSSANVTGVATVSNIKMTGSVTATGAAGNRSVTATTAFGSATLNNATATFPTVTGVTNAATTDKQGALGGGYTVTVTGTLFDTAAGVNIVNLVPTGAGSPVGPITATSNSATSISFVMPTIAAGTYDVRVTTNGAQSAINSPADNFVAVGPPTLASINPIQGTTNGGTVLTLTGTNFVNAANQNVSFTVQGSAPTHSATAVTTVSSTSVTGSTPTGSAGLADVVITTAFGTATLGNSYTYIAPTTITSINPAVGLAGSQTTVFGTHLDFVTFLDFGGNLTNNFTDYAADHITVVVPGGSNTVLVSAVSNLGYTPNAAIQFTYAVKPVVSLVSPASGPVAGGTSVQITGTDLSCTGCTSSVTVDGLPVPITLTTGTTGLTITTPGHAAATVDIRVTTTATAAPQGPAGGTSDITANDHFTYLAPPAPPVLNSVAPGSGPNGGNPSNVILTGSGFTGATSVSFGSVVIGPAGPSTFSVNLAGTQITVVGSAVACPACSASSNTNVGVFVTTPGGSSGTQPYTFTSPASAPTISSISPNNEPVNAANTTTSLITGTNFFGPVSVTFGGVASATVLILDSSHISATVPHSGTPGSVDVVVTAAGSPPSATLTGGFTYVAVCQNGGDQLRPWTGGSDVVGVAQASTSAFFAEGFTGANFHEVIAIHNPNATAIQVSVQYLLGSGAGPLRSYSVAGKGRINIEVGCDAGFNQTVSAKLTSSSNFVAERLMYFLFNSAFPGTTGIDGGNAALGAQAPGTSWYFAEGYTGYGFAEFLTVANPNPAPTTVNVTYFYNNGAAPRVVAHTLGANSRDTYFVNNEAGANVDVAALVSSTLPVVAERPIYFNYPGASGNLSGGTIAVGSPNAGSTDVNLAEGNTSPNFDEYVTLLNSTGTDAAVTIQYLLNGSNPVTQNITVPANRRSTVHVNNILGNGNVASSLHITSSQAVLVERSMYFNFAGRTGGHSAMAVPTSALATTALFAAGAANLSNSQYLTFENPNSSAITVTISFFDATGTFISSVPVAVAANSRATSFVNDLVPQDRSFSIEITGTGNFLVEQPTYFSF